MGQYKEALENFEKAIHLYEKIDNKKKVGGCLRSLAMIYRNMSDFEKSITFLFQSIEVSESIKDMPSLARSYNELGFVYSQQGKYTEAIKYQFKALKINEKSENLVQTARIYTNIGISYWRMEKYDEAILYCKKSLDIGKELNFKSHINTVYNTLGMIYQKQNHTNIALDYFIKCLEISKELGNRGLIGSSYGNIGLIYIEKKEYQKALQYLKKGLSIYKEVGASSSSANALSSIGQVFFELGDLQKAEQYLNEGIQLAEEINYPTTIRDGSQLMAKVQTALGKHKAALKYYERYHTTHDSLLGAEKTKQFSQLQIQYETEKKEQEIKSLAQQASIQNLELKQANLSKTIYASIAVFILLVGFVLFLVNKQKQLQLKQRAQNIEQNLLRVQMNPHFIFNAMTSIQDYMNKGDSKQAGLYLVKFSKLIRQVLDNSRNEFISLEQEINMLENYLSIQNLNREYPFTYSIELEEGLDAEEIAIPPMFAQPFIENAVKHGITSVKGNAKIQILFAKENDDLIVKISDNGIGIDETMKIEKKDHRSHAIKITEERIELYRRMQKKRIDFDIKNLSQGTEITFNLPFQYI